MDWMNSEKWKALSNNPGTFVAAVVSVVLLVAAGCGILQGHAVDPTTGEVATADTIVFNVNHMITEQQEIVAIANAKMERWAEEGGFALEAAELDEQNRLAWVNLAKELVTPYLPIASTAALLGGAGLIFDNRKKNRKIKDLKNGGQPGPPPPIPPLA